MSKLLKDMNLIYKKVKKLEENQEDLIECAKIGLGSFKQTYKKDNTRNDLFHCIEFMEKTLRECEVN